jgi:hypothetical protein
MLFVEQACSHSAVHSLRKELTYQAVFTHRTTTAPSDVQYMLSLTRDNTERDKRQYSDLSAIPASCPAL